ncbi:unnamed protein product [Rotaria sordida]|uniref:PDZ domain-containing protein n=2 Tax=Rotaria sordida TaxID=392033 RepID=A0A814TEF2_9BILA|nr:unnamed protein product [Rotaria sordida]
MMKFNDDFKEEVSNFLLSAVRQGDIKALEKHLSALNNPEIYLNRTYDEPDKQKCTLLMIACLNKFEGMVQILLNYSRLDLEVLNDIQLIENDQSLLLYQNVTVLWVAAAINNFKIVKLLVEHGAQINHPTKTNSTAFRCACWNGNIDMARYLNKNGADIHIAKIHNETNLIASVYNGRLKMTTYLVDELGCDVNESTDDGRSPLYFAVDRTSLELVRFLLNHGARNFRANYDQMSPLLLAADKRRIDLVDVISPQCSLLEQIEAQELFGSAFACREHGICNLKKSFEYFYGALELRSRHNLPKIRRLSTVEVLDNRQECQTMDELEKSRLNDDYIYIEALLVRERLLGSTNAKYHRSLRYRGAALIDNAQYHRGICFWLYELNLCRQHSLSININNLRQWASIFSDMTRKSISIPIVTWQTIITVIVEELEHNTKNFDYNLHTLLFLITIVSQLMATTQMMKVTLQRDSLHTPWGFRLQGGADFRTPFTINKINAGSPADGNLQRGDIILEINQQPISHMFHTDALELIQRAGGQITFLIQKGSNQIPHISLSQNQRSTSAVPWSYGNPSPSWSSSPNQLSPLSYFRNRPLERIPEPKPLLSQTGSPMMPGPVPSVSTKTRGYMQPPSFHTARGNQRENISYPPIRFVYPGPTYNHRSRTTSATTTYQNSSPWKEPLNNETDRYIPSYQKQVHVNPNVQTQHFNPPNLVHRQFNSPISLYSNDNVQEVMNRHINRVNHMNQGEFITDF